MPLPERAPETGKRVAVVGSGPAGMLAAWDLAVKGHTVTVYDAQSEPGGMLRWAVPAYRLPLEVLGAEWGRLEALGVSFQGNTALGRDFTLEQLSGDYDAVVLALGCPESRRLGVEGEDAQGVYHALDLLKAARGDDPPSLSGKVVVIGGGEVALDTAQTALRLGAESVTVVSLEDRQGMPATPEALALAEAEGVVLDGSWGPTRILTQDGAVSGLELKRCLAVLDNEGNFAPSYDECQLNTMEANAVIVAIGQEREARCPAAPALRSAHPADSGGQRVPGRRRGGRPQHHRRGHGLGAPGGRERPSPGKRRTPYLRPGVPRTGGDRIRDRPQPGLGRRAGADSAAQAERRGRLRRGGAVPEPRGRARRGGPLLQLRSALRQVPHLLVLPALRGGVPAGGPVGGYSLFATLGEPSFP